MVPSSQPRWLAWFALTALGCSDGVRTQDAGPDDAALDIVPTGDADDASDGAPSTDVSADGGFVVGPMGGAVESFRFAVFGDSRPPTEDATSAYPSMILANVMMGIAATRAQFAVATGDYVYARSEATTNAQLDLLVAAERNYPGYIFHAFGNHECTGATASNCPNGNETGNVRAFRARLVSDFGALYFDWTVRTSMGDAHFISTAPNAWSASQEAWLGRVLAVPARYTFVVAHQPPTSDDGPGSVAIETAVRARPGGVTLRLYGHTHDYRRITPNGVISGNAGAPLTGGTTYGFVIVQQRADGNVVVEAYDVGRPPTLADTFVVRPDGTATR